MIQVEQPSLDQGPMRLSPTGQPRRSRPSPGRADRRGYGPAPRNLSRALTTRFSDAGLIAFSAGRAVGGDATASNTCCLWFRQALWCIRGCLPSPYIRERLRLRWIATNMMSHQAEEDCACQMAVLATFLSDRPAVGPDRRIALHWRCRTPNGRLGSPCLRG